MALSRAAVRELDRRAIAEYGIPNIVLMENAGRNAAELASRLNPLRLRTAIACGPGNNGGDGLVMARHLDRLGWPVNVWVFADPTELSPDAICNFRIVERMGLPLIVNRHPAAIDVFSGFGWVVDALFGTGLSRPLQSPFDTVVNAINHAEADVLAIDVPTGLDCDTGLPLGATVSSRELGMVASMTGFSEM